MNATPDLRFPQGSPAYKRTLIALFCAGLANFALMYAPQPLLPEIAAQFRVSADASSWAIGATTIGVALGVLPLARLSDRVGRVRLVRWTLIASIVCGVAAVLAPTFETLIAARFVLGIALAGVPAMAVTVLAEAIHPRALGAAVGTYIAGTTVGGLAGRILAAAIADRWGVTAGLVAIVVCAAVATGVYLVTVQPAVVDRSSSLPFWPALASNLRNPGVMVLVAQAFLLMGGFVATYNYIAFRLEAEPFGLSLAQVSWLFLAYLAGTVSSRVVWRFAGDRNPTLTLFVVLGLMLGGLALTLFESLIAIMTGIVIYTAAFFAAHSIASGLIDRRATRSGVSLAPPLYYLGYYAGSSVLGWIGGIAFLNGGWVGTVALVAATVVLSGVLAAVAWSAR